MSTEKISQLQQPSLQYTASEIMEQLGYGEGAVAVEPLERAMHACAALQIPIKDNFHKIYCCRDGHMVADWQLSALACYLFMINCDPLNPYVAKAQLLFMMEGWQ